jgi:hypothetical protein
MTTKKKEKTLMEEFAFLKELVDNHYQIKGYKNREDFETKTRYL